jgi:SpoVK/Ycf46/Vps4 family AAA+-type ATPase
VVVTPVVEEILQEIVGVARGGEPLLRRWGFESRSTYGNGTAALFYGSPGTGKTHAARAVAGQLVRPLIEAKYAEIVSKWIGQSAKNLADLFARATREDAVLLIDECDSLLLQRGEAGSHPHDDGLVNVILTELESRSGLTILCTNLRARLDGALSRRLAFQVEFAPPDLAERVRLWQVMLPLTAPRDGGLDFEALATRYPMTGGLIRNAIRRACYRAARAGLGISQGMLEQAAAEEFAAQAGGQESRPRVVGFAR